MYPGFTLLELLIVIGIFIVMTGMLLANFRRGRSSDVVRIAALRFASDIQRMQAHALSGAAEAPGAVAYGVYLGASADDRYVLFGDRVRCVFGAEGKEVCAANGTYDAGVDPAEELRNGVIALPSDVTIAIAQPKADAVAVLFHPPRGSVTSVPDATEIRVTIRHRASGDIKTVTMNRISGRVTTE